MHARADANSYRCKLRQKNDPTLRAFTSVCSPLPRFKRCYFSVKHVERYSFILRNTSADVKRIVQLFELSERTA